MCEKLYHGAQEEIMRKSVRTEARTQVHASAPLRVATSGECEKPNETRHEFRQKYFLTSNFCKVKKNGNKSWY